MHRMTQQSITVSKIEAARRQLETAIRLYFSDGDPISVHTLTAAAYDVLRDVTAQTSTDPMVLRRKVLGYVRPPYKTMINADVDVAEDFFKRAYHGTSLDFNPDTTELMIFDACAQCTWLAGKEPPLFITYRIWFTANHPDVFILPDEFKEALQANALSIVEMGSGEYFSTTLPLISQMLDKR